MPYEMRVDGMAEISETLSKLEQEAPKAAAMALYEGAGIMAEEILQEMGKIKTAPFKYAKAGEKRLPSPEEKEVLEQASVGIAKFGKNGAEVDTSVGYGDGYAQVNFNHMNSGARTNYKDVGGKAMGSKKAQLLGKSGSNIKAIALIANAINSGTSFMEKQPFVRKAAKSGGRKAIEAMKKSIEKAFEGMTKN